MQLNAEDTGLMEKLLSTGHVKHKYAQRTAGGAVAGQSPQPRQGAGESGREKRDMPACVQREAEGRNPLEYANTGEARGCTAVSLTLCEYGLKPHVSPTWNYSDESWFKAKLADAAGFYLDPPDNAIVPCMDEKSWI